MRGYLTDKADVYSFGVVALEIVSGKSNTNYRPKEEFVYLLDWVNSCIIPENIIDFHNVLEYFFRWNTDICFILRGKIKAYVLQEQGNLLELVDPSLGENYSKEEAKKMLHLALLCTNPSPTLRPTMSSVVSMLEGKIPVQAPLVKRRSLEDEMRFKAFEKLSQDSQIHSNVSAVSQESQQVPPIISMDGPWIDSSMSFPSKDEVSLDHSCSRRLLPSL